MNFNIEHDQTAQKFCTEVNGEECLLAYTMINDSLHLHILIVPDGSLGEQVSEALADAAFNYAKANNCKIISSCDYIDEIYLKKHPEYKELLEKFD